MLGANEMPAFSIYEPVYLRLAPQAELEGGSASRINEPKATSF